MSGNPRSPSPTDSVPSEIHEPEAEWKVDDILAERVMKSDGLGHPAGTRCWLVKWTGFGLADATWEPQENLSDELLNMWQISEAEYSAGTKERFKVRDWKKACQKHWTEKVQKQERRNSKRARDGRSPQPIDDLEYIRETLKSVDSEDDSDSDVDWTMLDRNGAETNGDSEGFSTTSAESICSSHVSDVEERNDRSGALNDDLPVTFQSSRRKSNGKTPQSQRSQASSGQPQPSARSKQSVDNHPPRAPLPSLSRDFNRQSVTLRATKTPKPIVPEAIGNVFAGGKQPRKRKSIETAAAKSDGGRKELKPRLQNILNKRLRDGEGTRDPRQAAKMNANRLEDNDESLSSNIARSESPLFVSTDADMREASPSPPRLEPEEPGAHGCGLTSSGEATRSEEAVPQDHCASLPVVSKPRKTVRFGDEGPESMDVDVNNDLDVNNSVAIVPQTSADDKDVHVLRDITKTCEIGTRTLRVVFKGISSGLLSTHLAELEQVDSLRFTHTCSEADFILANAGIRASTIVTGRLGPSEARGALNNLNAQLLSRNQALLCYIGGLCVLLKPWTTADRAVGAQSHNPDPKEEPCFEIFRPTEAFEPGILENFEPNDRQSTPSVRSRASFEIDDFLQFDFGKLLPRNLLGSEPPSFFLLFPDAAQDECSIIVQWLRQCDASCGVFISVIPANWSHFRSLHNGVIIIHQDALEMVRLLPGLGDLLRQPDSDMNFTLWSFGHVNRSVCPDPTTDPMKESMTDPMTEPMPDSTHRPKQDTIVLEPLFPGGSVFLMTPSFLLAQPHCAYTFLKWFWQENVEKPPVGPLCKLMLFSGVDDWLTDVLVDLVAQTDDRFDENDAEVRDEINLRTKTQRLVLRLLSLAEDNIEDMPISPVLVTSEFIDANDEQSIVNWFSFWATQHLHEFRCFEVVGTGHSDRFRLTRRVRAPRYVKTSIIDAGAPLDDDGKDGLSGQHPPDEEAQETQEAQEALTLRQAVSTLYARLPEIEQEMLACRPPAILFRRPVSYFGPGMAVHLGEPGSKLASFDEWFSFFQPLHTYKGYKNTYLGFFYTIPEEWNPDAHPSEVVPPSRPWFAAFRPRDPARKPWRATELFIWDACLSRVISENDAVYESDLIPAQQALISMVAERTGDSSSHAHPALERVWTGGHESSDSSVTSLDHAINRLDDLIGNFKSDLRARSDQVHLCGWKVVEKGARPADSRQPPRKIERPRQFSLGDSEAEEEDFSRKIVFHPPKGDKKLYSRQIENRLMKEAQRAKNNGKEEFDFLFAPTQQWYGFLKSSRRHSEHIRVVQWSKLFKELGLPVRQH